MGVNKMRLTGGEPLVRHDLSVLVEKLAGVPGIRDIALTTNGMLLAEQASELEEAGLKRLNISLDSLRPRNVLQNLSPRGTRASAGGNFRRPASRLRKDPTQCRGDSRHYRGGDRAAGQFRPRARPGDAVHRVHAAGCRRRLGHRTGVVRRGDSRKSWSARLDRLCRWPIEDPSQPATDYAFADGGAGSGSSIP